MYLDDIVIYASSLQEHATKFIRLMDRLIEANLSLQPDKCEYLGHIISEEGVRPGPKKLETVKLFPQPRTAKNIRQFLGLTGYYRRFIKNFSKIAKPMSDLTRKDRRFEWTIKQHNAFETLRDALCEEPILQYPDFDKPFIITTDASGYAVGAVLSQGEIGKYLPIANASRILNEAETRYAPTERELLALIYAVQHFRTYVYGKRFSLVMDHKSLEWLHTLDNPAFRLMRWKIKLAECDYKIIYKPGRYNTNADALSRNPVTILPLQVKGKRSHSQTATSPGSPNPSPTKQPRGDGSSSSSSSEFNPDQIQMRRRVGKLREFWTKLERGGEAVRGVPAAGAGARWGGGYRALPRNGCGGEAGRGTAFLGEGVTSQGRRISRWRLARNRWRCNSTPITIRETINLNSATAS